jgi:predicted RecB family nuclease
MTGTGQGTKLSLNQLIQRATKGEKLNTHILFKPSLVYKVLRDRFWIWCDEHAPKDKKVDETTRYQKLQWQKGVEYEQAWVKEFHPTAVKIEPDFGYDALRNTLKAMLDGVPAIYQPHLWALGEEVYGKGDLLVREDSHRSDLGSFHYRVVEIKRSASLKDDHVLQAGFYNRMIGNLQGYTPKEMSIALKNNTEWVLYDDRKEREVAYVLRTWKDLRAGRLIPEPKRPPDSTDSPWRVFANQWIKEQSHLILLAGIQVKEREKLRSVGIHRVDQLWNLTLYAVNEILGNQYGKIAYHVAQAYKENRPILKPNSSLTIPRAKRHLYLDFETSDGVHPTEPAHVYLIGIYDAEAGTFTHFLGRGAEDEKRIFTEFLNYVGDPAETKLYHWTEFETGQINEVMNRWPDLRGPLTPLLASCVDLKNILQKSVYLPVPNFSIKSVAPALGFHWQEKGYGAFESMGDYWEYIDNGEEGKMTKVIQYNKDDCVAMWHVDNAIGKFFEGDNK